MNPLYCIGGTTCSSGGRLGVAREEAGDNSKGREKERGAICPNASNRTIEGKKQRVDHCLILNLSSSTIYHMAIAICYLILYAKRDRRRISESVDCCFEVCLPNGRVSQSVMRARQTEARWFCLSPLPSQPAFPFRRSTEMFK